MIISCLFQQDEYEGLVQVCGSKSENSSDRGSGDERRSSPEQGEYTFGITSLIDKREHLHAGDKVGFVHQEWINARIWKDMIRQGSCFICMFQISGHYLNISANVHALALNA